MEKPTDDDKLEAIRLAREALAAARKIRDALLAARRGEVFEVPPEVLAALEAVAAPPGGGLPSDEAMRAARDALNRAAARAAAELRRGRK